MWIRSRGMTSPFGWVVWGLLAVVLWSVVLWSTAAQAAAPVYRDDLDRAGIIASYEQQVQDQSTFLNLRLLASEYLKRYRETLDPEDLLRAETAARQSLEQLPERNGSAVFLLGSALVAQHRFQEALDLTRPLSGLGLQTASILMELGSLDQAKEVLENLPASAPEGSDVSRSFASVGRLGIRSRYAELTGDLARARQLATDFVGFIDQFYTYPVEARAWGHTRVGDLAFLMGDLAEAEARYRTALERFPNEIPAMIGLARVTAASHRWKEALEWSSQAAERIPTVDSLALKADAQEALGNVAGARVTGSLIEVVARLGSVQGIYDRSLAMYYADHGIHLPEALQIAQQERQLRADPYTNDALAWVLAANERWEEAAVAMQEALQWGTADPLFQFHAAVIADHLQQPQKALEHLQTALSQNPHFHHRFGDQARQLLVLITLGGSDVETGMPIPAVLGASVNAGAVGA